MTLIGRPLSLTLLVGMLAAVATTSLPTAWAQSDDAKPAAPAAPAPTPAQLEQAKKAFLEGKQLFDAKKYEPAVDKFKESYRLSRNPLLLYNIAFTLDSMGKKDMALFYYKKFLSDAPADAALRAEATPRAVVLEKELGTAATVSTEPAAVTAPAATAPAATAPAATAPAATAPAATAPTDDAATTGAATDDAAEAPPPRKRGKKRVDPSTYTADDFEHQIVEDAPPGRPLNLTAFAPDDSGWIVTMFYRGHGEAKFHPVAMKPRYNELVGRVPATKLTGVSIQYYIEVRTPDSKIVTRIGKPASPNIVYLDVKARPRFYPDLEDGDDLGGPAATYATYGGGGGGGTVPGGYTDVGSTKFRRAKWIATGTGVGLLGVSVTFYLMAASMSSSLEAEAALANDSDECDGEAKPCRRFNDDRKAVELAGQRNELVSRISFGLGMAATGVAAYLWYKEIKAVRRGERAAAAQRSGLDSMVAAPVVGDGFVGGAAALRF